MLKQGIRCDTRIGIEQISRKDEVVRDCVDGFGVGDAKAAINVALDSVMKAHVYIYWIVILKLCELHYRFVCIFF